MRKNRANQTVKDEARRSTSRTEVSDRELAVYGVGRLIEHASGGRRSVAEEALCDTPERVVRAFEEMLSGYGQDPADILTTDFPGEGFDEIIAVRHIEFTSLCEHHLMPFFGTAGVAYLPKSRVVGLSKIPRMVDALARRLQIQERLTRDICAAMETLDPRGVAVVIQARHECLACRGARKPSTEMVTSCLRGTLRDSPQAQAEALRLLTGA